MEKMRLGKTGLHVSKSAFGAIPIQRLSFNEAEKLLWEAYKNGINFFDTARMYTDSEEKIGYALSPVRKEIIIATKSTQNKRKDLLEDLQISLNKLKTDYIDIFQLHNLKELPDPQDPESSYAGLLEARKKDMIRFMGMTSHRLEVALEAAKSGWYDTVQFPLSFLSSSSELELIKVCREHDVGLIAMKALAGGLITDARTSFAFLRQFDNVVPIWGIEKIRELEEFVAMEKSPPPMDGEIKELMEKDREDLSGGFCRGCGYCMPCPVGIPINDAARMHLLLARFNPANILTEEWKEKMELITECQECGHCTENCPYGLEPPELLRKALGHFREAYQKYRSAW